MTIIDMKNIFKSFNDKNILNDLNLSVKQGSITGISGPSGSGKSTLMNIIGLLENFDSGEYTLLNKNVSKISKKEAMLLRRNHIGYLYQNYALVDNMTVKENLKIAMEYSAKLNQNFEIEQALNMVNIDHKEFLNKKIYTLSGGEQQRVAVSRLILKPCSIILADEPTGSLDDDNKYDVLKFLINLNNMGKTIFIVSHDADVLKICNDIRYL